MKKINYILIGVILMAFTGCGSNDTEEKEVIISQEKHIVEESSPQNVEQGKRPPALPKI